MVLMKLAELILREENRVVVSYGCELFSDFSSMHSGQLDWPTMLDGDIT